MSWILTRWILVVLSDTIDWDKPVTLKMPETHHLWGHYRVKNTVLFHSKIKFSLNVVWLNTNVYFIPETSKRIHLPKVICKDIDSLIFKISKVYQIMCFTILTMYTTSGKMLGNSSCDIFLHFQPIKITVG